MNSNDVIEAIIDGVCDDDFDKVYDAITIRKEHNNSKKLLNFRPGDTVVFNENSNPKYLRGIKVTTVKLNKKTITVDFPSDPLAKKHSGANNVRVPVSMVDLW